MLAAPDFEHPAPKQTGVAKIFLICTRTQNFGAKKNNYLQNYNIWEAPFYIVDRITLCLFKSFKRTAEYSLFCLQIVFICVTKMDFRGSHTLILVIVWKCMEQFSNKLVHKIANIPMKLCFIHSNYKQWIFLSVKQHFLMSTDKNLAQFSGHPHAKSRFLWRSVPTVGLGVFFSDFDLFCIV